MSGASTELSQASKDFYINKWEEAVALMRFVVNRQPDIESAVRAKGLPGFLYGNYRYKSDNNVASQLAKLNGELDVVKIALKIFEDPNKWQKQVGGFDYIVKTFKTIDESFPPGWKGSHFFRVRDDILEIQSRILQFSHKVISDSDREMLPEVLIDAIKKWNLNPKATKSPQQLDPRLWSSQESHLEERRSHYGVILANELESKLSDLQQIVSAKTTPLNEGAKESIKKSLTLLSLAVEHGNVLSGIGAGVGVVGGSTSGQTAFMGTSSNGESSIFSAHNG